MVENLVHGWLVMRAAGSMVALAGLKMDLTVEFVAGCLDRADRSLVQETKREMQLVSLRIEASSIFSLSS